MRALITGVSGFTGTHLARHLLAQDQQVFGFDQQPIPASAREVEAIRMQLGDVRDPAAVRHTLDDVRPDTIFHLVSVLKSDHAQTLYEINVLGTICLLESLVELGMAPKVLVTSSSAVYGPGSGQVPITERHKLRPITHYAASKAAQEIVAFRYFSAHQVPIICTRAFNLVGPHQPPTLACSAFAHQIALLEQRQEDGCVKVGNLEARRDFVDIRDAVHAYQLLAQHGRPGRVYNVCSGEAISIRRCLDLLLGMARVPLTTTADPARLQPIDVPLQVGSAARLVKDTGWTRRIPLEESLLDLLDDWRARISPRNGGDE